MKTLILLISQFFLVISFSYCQNNVIPNYSFEEMENGEEEKPTVKSEAQYLRHWERLNTADLYSTETNKLVGRYDPIASISGPNFESIGPYTLNAHSGSKYIGIGPCEGVRVQFDGNAKVKNHQWAKVKLHYAFRGTNTDTYINIVLNDEFSNNGVYDNLPDATTEPNSSCSNLDLPGYEIIKPIHLTTLSDQVPGVWYELETYILNTNNESMDNLFILGNNATFNLYGEGSNYIFIDDVSLEILDFCDHPCAWSNGPVQFGQYAINNNTTGNLDSLPNAMVGNCDGCIVEVNGDDEVANRFTLLNKNVNIFKFTVFNSWGQIEHKTELYSLSPLTNAGYSDWLFDWNGFGNIDNEDLPADVYVYTIEMRACNNSGYVNVSKSLTLLGILEPLPAHQPPLPNVYTSETCCPNERYIQNTTFETAHDYKHKVDEFILIGPDVDPTPNAQIGDVIFEPRTNVIFEAGNYVEFIPGVNGLNGPIDIDMDLNSVLNNNITVNIKPCISPNRNLGSPRDNFQYSNEKFIINNLDPLSNNNLIELYPTVTSNVFKLKSSLFNIEKVELIDNNGKIVQTEIKSFKETEIDCTALSGGFYFVKLFLENGTIVHKKVVKVE